MLAQIFRKIRAIYYLGTLISLLPNSLMRNNLTRSSYLQFCYFSQGLKISLATYCCLICLHFCKYSVTNEHSKDTSISLKTNSLPEILLGSQIFSNYTCRSVTIARLKKFILFITGFGVKAARKISEMQQQKKSIFVDQTKFFKVLSASSYLSHCCCCILQFFVS